MTELEALKQYDLKVTNPDKFLWSDLGIDKTAYVKYLMVLSPFILKYSRQRLLTSIRYPDGIGGKSFFQKNAPEYTPEWVNTFNWHDKDYILLGDLQTLMWLGNQAAIELHTSFNQISNPDHPDNLVLDLDPSKGQIFDEVIEVALWAKEMLDGLGLHAFIKTSGATGLQIYVPIEWKYTYDEARNVNLFLAKYLSDKHPGKITIERSVNKRDGKLYFDYLQMWQGKTIISAYSPRATEYATVSTPVSWEEVEAGIRPQDFTLMNITERLEQKGDAFEGILEMRQSLDFILGFLNKQ